jgi:predicted transcriptional regulator
MTDYNHVRSREIAVVLSEKCRMIQRLRAHGLLKKIGKRYKYYLTKLGKIVVTTALKLRELFVIPSLNQPVTQ